LKSLQTNSVTGLFLICVYCLGFYVNLKSQNTIYSLILIVQEPGPLDIVLDMYCNTIFYF